MPKQNLYISLLLAIALCPPGFALDGAQWLELNKAGQQEFKAGQFGEAERKYKAALDQLKGASESDIRFAESYSNLGTLYASRNQSAKAEPYFEKALKIKEVALGAQDREVVLAMSQLAQFYLSVGKKDKAQVYVDKLVEYGEREARQLIEISSAFKKLSNYYAGHRKLESAEIHVKQAENETLPEVKSQALETAVMLDSIGVAIKGDGDRGLRLAEKLFKSGLSLRQRSLRPDHAALSSSLENLGRVYLAQGRAGMAEPLLRRSFEISYGTLGMERRETQLRLEGLAQVLTAEGKLAEARSLYLKALNPDVDEKKGKGKFNPSADFLAGFAGLLVKEGRYSEAVPYYSRALKLQEAINGPQHASLANLLDSYAYALSKANRGEEAKRLTSRAKSIRG
ncbi:MAG: Tetratricopeptide repeat protein [Cyanobacteriota bacterium erpe_2018_sw_39hr_WHONDRS-SW48-000098_B_bin.30]|jgi:tetratricopeptide (TPR) repeat protein|nr:Tetratricopeptide repeat protein [Cyanobacteriota bacterium erpe_2018_sw_39hr_WHONDRS-SW48-000098_B_bin.30]